MRTLYEEIVRTLHYYAYFGHPLSASEVQKYLRVKASAKQVEEALSTLAKDGKVHCEGAWYAHEKEHLKKRKSLKKVNKKLMRLARRMGFLISLFPFVRGAYVSGSLSKEGADVDDDIDFFVITSPGRVWAAKLFLILFKKLCLLNSKRYFCINYLRSEDALVLSKRNIYIATEVVSLIPVYNAALLGKFMDANPWLRTYFPNLRVDGGYQERKRWYFWETLFAGKAGDILEKISRQQFTRHTRRRLQTTRETGHYEVSRESSAFFPYNHEPEILRHYHEPYR